MHQHKTRRFVSLLLILCLCLPAASTLGEPIGEGGFYVGTNAGVVTHKGKSFVLIPLADVCSAAADAMRLSSTDPGFVALMAQNELKTALAQGVPVPQDTQDMVELLASILNFLPAAEGGMWEAREFSAQNNGKVKKTRTGFVAEAVLGGDHRMGDVMVGADLFVGLDTTKLRFQDKKVDVKSQDNSVTVKRPFYVGSMPRVGVMLTPSLEGYILSLDGQKHSKTKFSPVVGAGIRYAFTENMFGTLGYKYVFGSHAELARALTAPLGELHDANMYKAISGGLLDGATVISSVGVGTRADPVEVPE